MILRNLEHKPIQASFSMLGLALATAILVVGGFNKDAINRMIDVQFQRMQRENVTVTFIEPRPARARYEVTRLPGVVRAEPYRSVAVRLRAGIAPAGWRLLVSPPWASCASSWIIVSVLSTCHPMGWY